MNLELEQYTLNAIIVDRDIREVAIKKLRINHFNHDHRKLFGILQNIFIDDMDTPPETYLGKLKENDLLNLYIEVGNNPILGVFSDRNIAELEREYLSDQYKNNLNSGNPDQAFEYFKKLKNYETVTDSVYPKEFILKEIREAIKSGISMEMYTTGLIDNYYKIVKKQTTIITGSPTSGKSNFLDAMMVNLAHKYNWRFLLFSPENQPIKLHLMNLARKFEGFPMMGTGKDSVNVEKFIIDHFTFVNTNEIDSNLDLILSLAKTKEIDGLVIDPWNEIQVTEDSDKKFIRQSISKLKKFSYKKNCHNFIIAHPTKLRKAQSGPYIDTYPPATAYDIDGASEWYSKPDNILSLWRDPETNRVEVHIQKIKFEGYTGQKGMQELNFVADTGGYI